MDIPNPTHEDVFNLLIAIAGWHENVLTQVQDGIIDIEVYSLECAAKLRTITKMALCVNNPVQSSLIEFWVTYRNFEQWGFVPKRESGYDFLPEITDL
jgi:hypothetical protein